MNDVIVKILRGVHAVPEYKTAGAAGCDISAAEHAEIWPGQRQLIRTGVSLEMPAGVECQVRSRSGLALSYGVVVFNAPSTIDADYTGELNVLLVNHGLRPFNVSPGDRIAQLVFAPVLRARFDVVDVLSATARGAAGWGSTGRR